MRRMNAPAYSGPLFVSILLSAAMVFALPQRVQAQTAPAAGTTVAVKMLDAVNSGSDPAGKQYRATVTKAVDAGNGVTIAQGAAATVTLTANGSSYTAQLSSITINGQVVAVTSNSASATSAAQSAASSAAASAVGSVLGGFGHHVSAPASVAIAATGQHISLPTGATLTFVLGASPTTAPAAPAPSSPQPMTASAEPAPTPTSSPAATSSTSAGGPLTAMYVCQSNPPPNPSDPGYGKIYLTAAFEVPVATEGSIPVIEPAFSQYLKATYQLPSAGIRCISIWTIADAQAAQKSIAGGHGKMTLVDTGWRYGQSPLTQGQSGFDPLAQGGIDLTQHRLTTYFCSLTAPGGTTMAVDMTKPNWNANMTTYVSPVFQADWDSAPVSMAYNVFIRDNYVHDLNPSADLSPRCGAQSPAMLTGMHQTAMISNKRTGKSVLVDFTDTPAEAAGGNAALAQVASATQAAAAQAAAGFFISCSTSGGAGIDTYYTGIMPIKNARTTPNGATVSPESQPILDHFYAYLTQKGYNFKPGSSSACDIARTAAAAQAAQHKRAYEGGGCSTCGKVVETGWKDSSN